MITRILFISLVLISSILGKAQVTNCNASFTFNVQGYTANFTSAMPNGTNILHQWFLGDGTQSAIANPSHTYSNNGVYLVKHKVSIYSTGSIICTDSVQQTVIINNTQPCNLQAYFTFIKDSLNRKTVYFTNQTAGFLPTDSIRWNFGDGSAFNYTTNPTHTYVNAGTYNVCIRVKRQTIATTPPCVSEICKVVVIDSILPVTCNANFTTNIVGLNVSVTPIQTALVQHQWNFGNGFTSNAIAPNYSYTNAGTYIIKHKVIRYANNSNSVVCMDSAMQTVIVQALNPCNIQAYYTSVRDTVNRKKYYFQNASVGYLTTDSIRWSFGDGTFSNDQNPVHTYANVGMYTVCIRIIRPLTAGATPCVREYCNIVIVDSVPNTVLCNANFTSTTSGATVSFVSAMQTATHSWSFGNGGTSNIANPVYTYSNGGVYTVKHKVTKIGLNGQLLCADSVVKTVIITQPCNLQAYFTYAKDSANKKKVYFSNTTVGFLATDSIRWNFGDGTAFNYTANPTHTYSNYGTYNVCIRVKRNSPNATSVPCISEICKIVVVDSNGVTTSNCNYFIDFTMRRDNNNIRLVHFTNTSAAVSGAVATWTFGDGTTATGWNVSHLYPTNGTVYQPCLRITYSNTCSKIKCKVLQLPLNNACNLQPYPNPATTVVNGNVQLTTPQIIYTRIYNSNNIIVRQQQQNGFVGFNTISVNIATLPFGMYRMDVQYGTNVCRALFMKQ